MCRPPSSPPRTQGATVPGFLGQGVRPTGTADGPARWGSGLSALSAPRGPLDNRAMTGKWIVVGVDGSDRARPAVEWAVEEAQRRGAALQIVHGRPTRPGYPLEQFLTIAHGLVSEAVAWALTVDPFVPVASQVRDVPAADALVAASERADLLVVGARGCDSTASDDLGTIARACVQRAACPVVVVRPELADALVPG